MPFGIIAYAFTLTRTTFLETALYQVPHPQDCVWCKIIQRPVAEQEPRTGYFASNFGSLLKTNSVGDKRNITTHIYIILGMGEEIIMSLNWAANRIAIVPTIQTIVSFLGEECSPCCLSWANQVLYFCHTLITLRHAYMTTNGEIDVNRYTCVCTHYSTRLLCNLHQEFFRFY